jgi:hypothetical protein
MKMSSLKWIEDQLSSTAEVDARYKELLKLWFKMQVLNAIFWAMMASMTFVIGYQATRICDAYLKLEIARTQLALCGE